MLLVSSVLVLLEYLCYLSTCVTCIMSTCVTYRTSDLIINICVPPLHHMLLIIATVHSSDLQIERVVNPKIWERYVYRKREIAESNNGFANERMLFHGEMCNYYSCCCCYCYVVVVVCASLKCYCLRTHCFQVLHLCPISFKMDLMKDMPTLGECLEQVSEGSRRRMWWWWWW